MTSRIHGSALLGAAIGMGLLLLEPGLANARQGFYFGVGAAQTSVGSGLDGTHSYQDPSGNPQFVDGKMKDGSGVAAEVGYGFNRHFGVEYLYEDTSHTASSTVASGTSNAEFISQVFGIRLTAPFSKRFEAFLRGGYGMYEADYSTFSKNAANQRGKVAFDGTGSAIGAGFEMFFQELGIELGYTQHSFAMDRAKPAGGQSLSLPSKLNGDASTVDLMFSLHF